VNGAATIVFANEDLSIPGAPEHTLPSSGRAAAARDHFFNLVNESEPDVIVLDFSGAPLTGSTIRFWPSAIKPEFRSSSFAIRCILWLRNTG
jgi:hypothetical protein